MLNLPRQYKILQKITFLYSKIKNFLLEEGIIEYLGTVCLCHHVS